MLTADPSQRTAPHRPERAPWFHSQWAVFWTIVGALLTAGMIAAVSGWLLMLAVANVVFDSARFKDVTQPSSRVNSRASVSAEPPAYASPQQVFPTTETVRVPGRSTEDCLAEAGGVANELYARCRRGYSYTRPIAP